MDPLPPADLQQAIRDDLRAWYSPMLSDPARLASRGYQSYIVLTLSRMLYTLQTGAVGSKPTAARWAQAVLGEPWAPLIERALAHRHPPYPPADPADVRQTQDLIRYLLEVARAAETSNEAGSAPANGPAAP
jgi:hypothetical protein